MSISVVVADDQRLVREGLVSLLKLHDDLLVVGVAGEGEEAVGIALRDRPDVVLMDLRMPRLDGLEATRRLCGITRVIALTTYRNDALIRDALAAGARGFLSKDVSAEALAAAVRSVAGGGTTFDVGTVQAAGEHVEALSPREREILALIVGGARNDDIAQTCSISRATVKSHVNALFSKLGAQNRLEAVRRALSAGLVD